MHSLEPEIQDLQRKRAVRYLGIAAVMTGVGLVVKQNLDRIGPMMIVASIALAAALCYLPALRAWRAGVERRLPADLLLLLATLLVSVGIGYAEYRFNLFGDHWTGHFLVLAVLHGFAAYLLGSRLVLSVALTSFAVWIGAASTFSGFFPLSRITVAGTAWRTLACAAICVGLRHLHASRWRRDADFVGVHEGFAVHLAGVGAVLLTLPGYLDRPMPQSSLWQGMAVLGLVVALIGWIGWRRRQESFVLAALAYGVMGLWRLQFHYLSAPLALTTSSLLTLIGATMLLWRVHARLRDRP